MSLRREDFKADGRKIEKSDAILEEIRGTFKGSSLERGEKKRMSFEGFLAQQCFSL